MRQKEKYIAGSSKHKRNVPIDILRFALSFMIVAIHAELFRENTSVYIALTHFNECAIPLFAIITGYFFYANRMKNGGRYTWRFIRHILWVYLLWSTIIYLTVMTREQIRAGYVYLNVRAWLLDEFTLGKFWYFGAIILFAVAMELKIRIEGKLNSRTVDLLTVVMVGVLGVLLELTGGISGVIGKTKIYSFFHADYLTLLFRRIVLYALPFMFLGHFVHRYWDKLKWVRNHALFLSFLGMALYVAECIVVDQFHPDVGSMVPYVMTIAFFIWIVQKWYSKRRRSQHVADYLRCMSGFVYCIHGIPIYYFRKTPILQIVGVYSWLEYIYTVFISILLGTVLYQMIGNKMRKIIA